MPSTYTFISSNVLGSTTNSYTSHRLFGNGTTAIAEGSANQSQIRVQSGALVTSSGNPFVAASIVDFHDYTSTTKNKTVRAFAGCNDNSASISEIGLSSGVFMDTTAITSITLRNYYTDFGTNCVFSLYGIKGA